MLLIRHSVRCQLYIMNILEKDYFFRSLQHCCRALQTTHSHIQPVRSHLIPVAVLSALEVLAER